MARIVALISTLALLGSGGWAQQRADLLVADFEASDYGQWKVEGECFGPGPARGTLANQMQVSGFLGKGLVNTYYRGDGTTGRLTSPPFVIERRFINFLIGGGMAPGKTCINLLIDGKIVRTATGPNDRPGGSEALDWATWDVGEFAGKSAVIQIVDQATGGWGHINIDHILQSDQRKEIVVSTELYNETYRPQFHFTAKANWLNDPNGLVFHDGTYHLFFQHNPSGTEWGNMTWGHAVSSDLVHWKQLEHALLPDRMGTMFSGSAVVDWHNTAGFQKGDQKTLVAIYTAAGGTSDLSKGQPFTQCIAYSTDGGRTWTKYDKNPVLKHIVEGNRDPKVVWYEPGRTWIMALYLSGSRFAFFSSPNLKDWTHLHDLDVPGCDECPDFFPMPVDGDRRNVKWVWTAANGKYLIGSFDGKRFVPETKLRQTDWGKNFYAVQSYSDIPEADGRRIQIAWMRGGRYPKMPFNQQMNFPCEMKLRTTPQGLRIFRMPVSEIERLHTKTHEWSDCTVPLRDNPLAGITGELFDIHAEIDPADSARFGFVIRGEKLVCSVADKTITCLGASAPLDTGKPVKLRILIDRSSIEAFANDGEVVLSSCFTPRPDNRTLQMYTEHGQIRIRSMRVREMKSAWR